MQYKEDFLCVIEDKMDHSKTTLPQFQMKNKMVSRLGQLLVTLIIMIFHGQGDEAFVQYSNELLPNDPNFTIGSLLCLFRKLEKEQVKESWVVIEFEPQNTFIQQILQGSSCCLNALRPSNKIVGVKPLLRKLLLHLNMVFISLLIV